MSALHYLLLNSVCILLLLCLYEYHGPLNVVYLIVNRGSKGQRVDVKGWFVPKPKIKRSRAASGATVFGL